MLVLYCLVNAVICVTLSATMMLEKMADPSTVRNAKFLIKSILDAYNEYLANIDIHFELEDILDYSTYSKMPEFRELGYSIGHPSLEKRIDALRSSNRNLIILFSTMEECIPPVSDLNPCRMRFFYKCGTDIINSAVEATISWMESILNTSLPKFDNLIAEFGENVKTITIKKEITKCSPESRITENKMPVEEKKEPVMGHSKPKCEDVPVDSQAINESKKSSSRKKTKRVRPFTYNIQEYDKKKEDLYKKFR